MTQVDAIYQNGVFKPVQVVDLLENQRVRLSIQSLQSADVRSWLVEVQELQLRIATQRGFFPDSAADIAEDRKR